MSIVDYSTLVNILMFILLDHKQKEWKEGTLLSDNRKMTWDDVPQDIKIGQIKLSYPFRVNITRPDGQALKNFSPTFLLGRFDRYFFFNEGIVKLIYKSSDPTKGGQTELEAKVIAGIDDKNKIVVEARMDKYGNVKVNEYPLSHLEELITNGQFRADIIRNGV